MNKEKIEITEKPFDVLEVKKEIEKLLEMYRAKKDDLEWADDDWVIDEINEELDQYAKKIKVLKSQVQKFEHKQA